MGTTACLFAKHRDFRAVYHDTPICSRHRRVVPAASRCEDGRLVLFHFSHDPPSKWPAAQTRVQRTRSERGLKAEIRRGGPCAGLRPSSHLDDEVQSDRSSYETERGSSSLPFSLSSFIFISISRGSASDFDPSFLTFITLAPGSEHRLALAPLLPLPASSPPSAAGEPAINRRPSVSLGPPLAGDCESSFADRGSCRRRRRRRLRPR